MSVSAINTDSYTTAAMSRPQPPAGGAGKPPGGGEDMDSLLTAIEEGDTETVEDLLAEMPSVADADDPMADFLSDVSAAAEAGDVEAMQAAADSFVAAAPQGGLGGPQNGGMQPPEGALAGGGGADFSSLIDALSSGDSEAASSAYETLTASLEANAPAGSDANNPLAAAMAEVGELIEAGDTEAAAAMMEDITAEMPRGQLVHMTA
ncbi:hypothetical protein Q4485_17305 [Granulosicoccaceae sp. 1_MG-2023]|nr:hypothetical protein [Granulosicoccaceae sp. 1_MG-2023]